MGLGNDYSERFERVWKVWKAIPQPRGRSKKQPSYKAFASADKLLKFTEEDLDIIIADMEARAREDARWQINHGQFVPMFSTYFNQRWWNEDYTRVKKAKGAMTINTDEEDEQRKMWQLTAKRQGIDAVPQQYRHFVEH